MFFFLEKTKNLTKIINNRKPSFSRYGNVYGGVPRSQRICHCHCDCKRHPLVLIIQMNIIHAQWFYYIHVVTVVNIKRCNIMYIFESIERLNSKRLSVMCNV